MEGSDKDQKVEPVPLQLFPPATGLTMDPSFLPQEATGSAVSLPKDPVNANFALSQDAGQQGKSSASSYFSSNPAQSDAFTEAMNKPSATQAQPSTFQAPQQPLQPPVYFGGYKAPSVLPPSVLPQRPSVTQHGLPSQTTSTAGSKPSTQLINTAYNPSNMPQSQANPIQTTGTPAASSTTSSQYPTQQMYKPSVQVPPQSQPNQTLQPTEAMQYKPVTYHWYYHIKKAKDGVWMPFSSADSSKLEQAFLSGQSSVIATDGGRYDVNVQQRVKTAIYWPEDPIEVQRCSWFSKLDTGNRFEPYTEAFSKELEEHYRACVTSNTWHKRHECSTGDTVVVHSPTLIVHFHVSAQPDEWGTTMGGDDRPRVVRRGLGDWEQVPQDESEKIDHLLFVVHGIGPICDIRFRSIFEVVDDLRSRSNSLMRSHYPEPVSKGLLHRLEYIPVEWHAALHSDAVGIDQILQRVTLPSAPKIREYANDVIADALYYTSPKYCQKITDRVCNEINRLHALFKRRNPNFRGRVSLIGHSLGSVILFDILSHQGEDGLTKLYGKEVTPPPKATTDTTEEVTLESLLGQLGLSQFCEKLNDECIDSQALLLCSEEDLKELGLPLGARRKLMQYITRTSLSETSSTGSRPESPPAVSESTTTASVDAGHRGELLRHLSVTDVQYNVTEGAGIGQPSITYPLLDFSPECFFALGSPISLFLTVRGFDSIPYDYTLPTCKRVFNIFHPYDAVAYRIEPMIIPDLKEKPVLIPHYKGRKRMHLEVREYMSKLGTDLKQKLYTSVQSTWKSLTEFANAHKMPNESVEAEVERVVEQQFEEELSGGVEEEVVTPAPRIGSLNGGERVDYMLQESPAESFNEYLFAITSHGCYWESEDTALSIVKQVYLPTGFLPTAPGVSRQQSTSVELPSQSSGVQSSGATSHYTPAAASGITPLRPPVALSSTTPQYAPTAPVRPPVSVPPVASPVPTGLQRPPTHVPVAPVAPQALYTPLAQPLTQPLTQPVPQENSTQSSTQLPSTQ